jgi:hypothetical protein
VLKGSVIIHFSAVLKVGEAASESSVKSKTVKAQCNGMKLVS